MKEKIHITIHRLNSCRKHRTIQTTSDYWLFESDKNIDFYYQNKLIAVKKYEK